jgi:hypothetical protein
VAVAVQAVQAETDLVSLAGPVVELLVLAAQIFRAQDDLLMLDLPIHC